MQTIKRLIIIFIATIIIWFITISILNINNVCKLWPSNFDLWHSCSMEVRPVIGCTLELWSPCSIHSNWYFDLKTFRIEYNTTIEKLQTPIWKLEEYCIYQLYWHWDKEKFICYYSEIYSKNATFKKSQEGLKFLCWNRWGTRTDTPSCLFNK